MQPEPPERNPIIPEGINVHQHNPLKELALLVGGFILALVVVGTSLWYGLSWMAQFIPYSWEQRLAANFIDEQSGRSDTELALQKRLDHLVNVMVNNGNMPMRVHYLPADTINAFATLGGQIFVYQGLLDAVHSDIGLDMVLAHEAAHIVNRDPIQSLTATLGVQLIFSLVTGNSDIAQLSGLMGTGGQLLMLSYSRKQERAADALALDTLEKLYPDLTGAGELFHYILMHSSEMSFPEFLSSHPDVEGRIENINQRIQQKK